MRNRCARVARPSRTSRTPVANGSSVPAWPTLTALRPPRSRRMRATTSCDVTPAGLSTTRTPDVPASTPASLIELRGDLAAQEGHELVVGQLRGEARRLPVPAATARAGDDADVNGRVGGPQRDLRPARASRVGQLARERGHLRAGDRAEVVDDALGVGLLGAGLGVVLAAQAAQRQPPVVEAPHRG